MRWRAAISVGGSIVSATIVATSIALDIAQLSAPFRWDWRVVALIANLGFFSFVYYGWYSTHRDLQECKDVDYKRHCDLLMNFLKSIGRIDTVAHNEQHLINWWNRPQEGYCSIPKGEAHQQNKETVVVLNVESTEEWACLKQHLKGSSLLRTFESWKVAMSHDLTSRRMLFDAIIKEIENDEYISWIQSKITSQEQNAYLTPRYVETIYYQVLYQLLGIPYERKRREEFKTEDFGKVWLAGELVIRHDYSAPRDYAIDFLLKAQIDMVKLKEAQEVKKRYQEAQTKTNELNSEINKIIIAGILPLKSRCDLCPY